MTSAKNISNSVNQYHKLGPHGTDLGAQTHDPCYPQEILLYRSRTALHCILDVVLQQERDLQHNLEDQYDLCRGSGPSPPADTVAVVPEIPSWGTHLFDWHVELEEHLVVLDTENLIVFILFIEVWTYGKIHLFPISIVQLLSKSHTDVPSQRPWTLAAHDN